MVSFSFPGRYTLREINSTWYIYDREKQTTTERLKSQTFKGAKQELIKYKEQNE